MKSKARSIALASPCQCHNGNTARGGHYTSMVRKGNQYICCNDSLKEIRPSDDLLETAYRLVYAKVNEELPQFVAPFLSCFKANLGNKC